MITVPSVEHSRAGLRNDNPSGGGVEAGSRESDYRQRRTVSRCCHRASAEGIKQDENSDSCSCICILSDIERVTLSSFWGSITG